MPGSISSILHKTDGSLHQIRLGPRVCFLKWVPLETIFIFNRKCVGTEITVHVITQISIWSFERNIQRPEEIIWLEISTLLKIRKQIYQFFLKISLLLYRVHFLIYSSWSIVSMMFVPHFLLSSENCQLQILTCQGLSYICPTKRR